MRRFLCCLAALCLLLMPICTAQEEEKNALELQRSVSHESVSQGESVTLVYRVENTGNAELQNVEITDAVYGKIASLESLAAGEYRTFQVRLVIAQKCSSVPSVTWRCDGKDYYQTLDAVDILPVENRLKIALTADRDRAAKGDIVTLTVYLRNDGDTTLRDISLQDAALGDLGTLPMEIAPGETVSREFKSRATQAAKHCIRATALAFSGDVVTAQSNEVEIALTASSEQSDLKISADLTDEEAPVGMAWVKIVLDNRGDTAIEDVTVSESSLGAMRTLRSVVPGITTFQLECPVQKKREMQFLAQFTAPNGTRTIVLSEKIEPSPGTVLSQELLPGEPMRLGTSAYAAFMYFGIGLIALLLICLVIVLANRRRKKRILRVKRAQHMRVLRKNARLSEAEWVQTRPHKPVYVQIKSGKK